MRFLSSTFFCLTLLSIPVFGSAEVADMHPPDLSESFDDVDDATRQAEIIQQAQAFLDNLHNHWGQNPERLRTAIAGRAEQIDQSALVYLRNIAAHGVLESYEFRRESLVSGRYMLVQRPVNGLNEFIGYYSVLKQFLSNSYGGPTLDEIVWDHDLYRSLPDYWGVAVMIGHLHYYASWNTADGTISLELTGNRHSKLLLEYTSYQAGTPT